MIEQNENMPAESARSVDPPATRRSLSSPRVRPCVDLTPTCTKCGEWETAPVSFAPPYRGFDRLKNLLTRLPDQRGLGLSAACQQNRHGGPPPPTREVLYSVFTRWINRMVKWRESSGLERQRQRLRVALAASQNF